MKKISLGTLQVGKPLVVDYFDADGVLLLRRGYVLQTQRQLEDLLERGLFEKTEEEGPTREISMAEIPRLANPFDLIDRCKSRLTALLDHVRIDDPAQVVEGTDVESLKAKYRDRVAERSSTPDAMKAMPDGVVVRIQEIAKVLQKACIMDADAALGYVHLGLNGRYAIMHPLHCAILAEVLGSALQLLPEQRLPVIAAALTTNIAILNLQERLHKHEGELTPAQRSLLRMHPVFAREMLLQIGVTDEDWLQAVLLHHERFDGSGYPFELKDDAIPLPARIVALADIYDAMIKPRGYRKPLVSKEALREIFLKRGGKVDENLAKSLIKEFSLYPPGSFVRLRNGEIAIVFRRGQTATTPLVRSVVGPRGAPLERPLRRNTSETHHVIVDIAPRDPTVHINFSKLWDYDKN